MQDPEFLADLAFLTDMTQHLNELNLKLQGKQHNIANLYGYVNGFKNKLILFKTSLEKSDFSFFPSCKEHYTEMGNFEGCNFSDHLKYTGLHKNRPTYVFSQKSVLRVFTTIDRYFSY